MFSSIALLIILDRTPVEEASSAIEKIAQEHAANYGHTLFLRDISGSMGSYRNTVERRLGVLGSSGMLAGDHPDIGSGGEEFPDFLVQLHNYARRKDIDTLYVFADFNWDWDGTGRGKNECVDWDEGTEASVDLLESTNWRIYFETVNCDPPPALARLARKSGGGVIRTAIKE